MQQNYTEKYRPIVLPDVVGQDSHVEKFRAMIATKSLPHLLFYGPAGTGKTTCARILANSFNAKILHMNASDERGIDVMRDKVKHFMSTLSLGTEIKIILMEEADQLTRDAQLILRAIMEKEESNCIIIFCCNYPEKIDDKIISRCSRYEFKPISRESAQLFISRIVKAENINITPAAVGELARICKGDLRMVCRVLQDLAILGRKITIEDIRESKDLLEQTFTTLLELVQNKKTVEAVTHTHEYFKTTGFNPRSFLSEFRDYIIDANKIGHPDWFLAIAETDMNLASGGTDVIQIDGFVRKLIKLLN